MLSPSLARSAGFPLVLLGFAAVLLSRGCMSTDQRYYNRVQAELTLASEKFEDEWDAKLKKLNDEREEITSMEDLGDTQREKLDSLNEDIRDLAGKKRRAKSELEGDDWSEMRESIRDAKADALVWAYRYEQGFILGTILLTGGLLLIGFTSSGPERWICLVLLAVITLSIYVGGAAWIVSLRQLTN